MGQKYTKIIPHTDENTFRNELSRSKRKLKRNLIATFTVGRCTVRRNLIDQKVQERRARRQRKHEKFMIDTRTRLAQIKKGLGKE